MTPEEFGQAFLIAGGIATAACAGMLIIYHSEKSDLLGHRYDTPIPQVVVCNTKSSHYLYCSKSCSSSGARGCVTSNVRESGDVK